MFTNYFAKIFEKPSYWRYWLAYTLSAIGFELISFALMVVLFDLLKTSVSMGRFTAISMFCMVVFGPFIGIYVDVWDRKKIFFTCNALLAILIFSLKYLVGSFWIYFIWFLASLVFVFLRPARVALITNLFPVEDYFKANSAFMMSLNFSKIGGPLIGGALLVFFSREWAMNIILSFFILSCVLISTMHFHAATLDQRKRNSSKWSRRDLTTGVRFILSHERLRFFILVGFLWRLFLACQLPLYIVFIKNHLGGSTQEYSLFMTILASGGAVGSLVAGGVENLCSRNRMIYGGLGISYFLFALLAIFQSYLLSLILIGLSNMFFYIAHVAIHSDIQKVTPNEIRGKVFASSPTLLIPIGLVSILIAAPLADKVGVQWVFLCSGLMALATLPLVGCVSKAIARSSESILSKAGAVK